MISLGLFSSDLICVTQGGYLAHLFRKLSFVTDSISPNGTDGLQYKLPHILRGDVMTAATVAMAVGRAVVEIIRAPAGLSGLAPAVVHESAALCADQFAGQGIGCAGAVRPSADI